MKLDEHLNQPNQYSVIIIFATGLIYEEIKTVERHLMGTLPNLLFFVNSKLIISWKEHG